MTSEEDVTNLIGSEHLLGVDDGITRVVKAMLSVMDEAPEVNEHEVVETLETVLKLRRLRDRIAFREWLPERGA